MGSQASEVEQLHTMLARVEELLARASNGVQWKPRVDEAAFLEEVANQFDPHLPANALTAKSVAAAFLATAKTSLVNLGSVTPACQF